MHGILVLSCSNFSIALYGLIVFGLSDIQQYKLGPCVATRL